MEDKDWQKHKYYIKYGDKTIAKFFVRNAWLYVLYINRKIVHRGNRKECLSKAKEINNEI